MKKLSRVLAIVLVLAMVLPGIAQATTGDDVERIAGKNRYYTAVEASKDAYTSADTVVIVNGQHYADALTATVLAAKLGGPLLTANGEKDELPEVVADEIERLGATKVVIVGGPAAVGAKTYAALKDLVDDVERIEGKDRYETAEKVAKEVGGSDLAFLVRGNEFADALAVGPVAAKEGAPIFLTKTNELGAATKAALADYDEVVVVGGTSAVSAKVYTDAGADNRIEGKNRWATALEVAKEYFPAATEAYLASGEGFADALVAGYLGALNNAPVLLTAKKALNADVKEYLEDKEVTIVGGEAAVSKDVANSLVEDEAEELKVVSVSAINATQIEVKFNKEVVKTTAEEEANYKINGAALADGTTAAQTPAQAKAVLKDGGKNVIITLADAKANNTALTFQVDGVKDSKENSVKSEIYTLTFNDKVAPVIEKLEIAPSGDLEITFSEPLAAVDPIVRVNGTPVTITSVTAGDVKVVVPVGNLPTIAKGATVAVYVAGAKDTAGNEMALYNGSVVKPNDTTPPVVTSLTQIGQNEVRFVFSKALGAGASDLTVADVKVLKGSTIYTNGVAGTIVTVTKNTTVDSSGKTYDVTFDLAGGGTPNFGIYEAGSSSQTVIIMLDKDAVKDGFGNGIAAYSQSITFNKDEKGPQFVSAKVAADKQTIEVTFDEVFVTGTVNIDETKIIITNQDGVRFDAIDADTNTKGGAGNEKILLVDFVTAAGTIVNGTYTLQFQKGVVKDAYGNLNDVFSTTVKVGDTADTTKPVATLDGSSDENSFVVAFGEEVTSSALNVNNYKLDGVSLPAGTVTYFIDANKDKVAIVLPEGSINIGKVGTGTDAVLNVKNVADKAGNAVDSTNLTVKISDNTAAIAQSVLVIGNDIIITFNEEIDNGTAVAINDKTKLAADFEIKVGNDTLVLDTSTVAVSRVPGDLNKVKITLTPNGTNNWDPTKTISVKVLGATLKDANLWLVKSGVLVSN